LKDFEPKKRSGIAVESLDDHYHQLYMGAYETKEIFVSSRYPEQISQAVYLIKGSYYFIEGLHKQQYGNDTFSVGVQTPDKKKYYPIPSQFLWTTTPPKPNGMPFII